ncbi:MAG: hypothetical protein ACRC4N_04310 [Gammaproteobacteria bacterium]
MLQIHTNILQLISKTWLRPRTKPRDYSFIGFPLSRFSWHFLDQFNDQFLKCVCVCVK